MSNANEIWGRRLKEARLAAGLSQKQLGIQAGLDEFVASTRINRYELGVHKADYKIAQNLSKILNVPTGYFYTEEDNLAELMLTFHLLSTKKKNEILKFSRALDSIDR
ncbi:helix-turn-helix domain-containing protein [Collimonas arenae]|uniref:helix-turn-helix domain-containing protein n=1 Tax=Collimonas arenae TaxID=279058 RepID=UPI0005701A8D|nr:helix-turn-helix transcriptional regulator [Collimonas arenae]